MKRKYSIAIVLILLISLLAVVSSASNKIDTAKNPAQILKPDIIKEIKVNPDIITGKSATFKIDLSASRVSGNVPLKVQFHDRSIIKGTQFGGRYWDFASNDASSQEKDPVYTFRKGGLYEVTLEEWAYGFNEKKASILIGVNDPNANPCAKKGPNWIWVGGPSYCPTCEMTDIDDITTSEHHDCMDPGKKKIEGKYVSSS
jgi:hypothetical protein